MRQTRGQSSPVVVVDLALAAHQESVDGRCPATRRTSRCPGSSDVRGRPSSKASGTRTGARRRWSLVAPDGPGGKQAGSPARVPPSAVAGGPAQRRPPLEHQQPLLVAVLVVIGHTLAPGASSSGCRHGLGADQRPQLRPRRPVARWVFRVELGRDLEHVTGTMVPPRVVADGGNHLPAVPSAGDGTGTGQDSLRQTRDDQKRAAAEAAAGLRQKGRRSASARDHTRAASSRSSRRSRNPPPPRWRALEDAAALRAGGIRVAGLEEAPSPAAQRRRGR